MKAGVGESIMQDVFAERCPICGSLRHLQHGSCLGCLLKAGMEEGDESEEIDFSDIPDGDWRLGGYELLEEIGRGGMGIIYRARQPNSNRLVALKRILPHHDGSKDSAEFALRLRREAEAAASLDHPNVLPIYEVGNGSDGLPFFSMKLAGGGNLATARKRLAGDPKTVVELMLKVARAVQYAHNQKILHRDLKPGNILLDGRGEPMVADFGLAKWLERTTDLTQTLTTFGTPGYVAPEQAIGSAKHVGPAADIYSLGAILFELLCGRLPFVGENAWAVVRQAAETPAPSLRKLLPGADRDLETICARCLERDPLARYRTAGDLADDLQCWLDRRPIHARPVSLPERGWRWVKRNRVLAGVGVVSLAIAMISIANRLETVRVGNELLRSEKQQFSVAIIPFLDLETLNPDSEIASTTGKVLQAGMNSFGANTVQVLVNPLSGWTGVYTPEEIKQALVNTGCRTVLAGTIRKSGDQFIVSARLIGGNGSDVMKCWRWEVASGADLERLLVSNNFAAEIHNFLTKNRDGNTGSSPDAAELNSTARGYMVAGRDLIMRRTVTDLDRAIACFQGAIDAESRSVEARSYLAIACMGRFFLLSDANLWERGLKAAKEAVQIAPNNPSADRAFSSLSTANGQYAVGLEYALRAIENGDQSERACGLVGYALRAMGKPDQAMQWYLKGEASLRQPADYDSLIGDCWADMGNDEKASYYYKAADRFHPDLPEGWLGLCRLQLLAGDFVGAETICNQRASGYAGSSMAPQMAALVKFYARDFEGARKLYSGLYDRDPAGGGRGGIYGLVDYRSALARMEPDQSKARTLLAECIETETRHLAVSPQDAEALYRLAAIEVTLGETKSALQHLREAELNGWRDYRSARLDPRFDALSGMPEFNAMLSEGLAKAASLASSMTTGKKSLIKQ